MNDYLFDKQGEDPEVARLETLLGEYGHRAPMRPVVARRRRYVVAGAAAVLAAAATVAFLLAQPDPDRDETPVVARELPTSDEVSPDEHDPPCGKDGLGFAFATEGGAARCAGETAGSGVLPIGEWLETSLEVSARVEVADIGDLTVYGGSRVRLVASGPDEHRLELAQGRVSARVVAPPRLFVVDTPGASAVDLGCAYELAVTTEGGTHLQVMTGAVSLEGNGIVAHVAAGSEVHALPGRGPGTPIVIDAPQPLRDAVARFDSGDATALPQLLALADRRDAFTLWNLLGRTQGEARSAVYRRLDAIVRHPSSVGERDILDGQPAALEAWRESIEQQPWRE